MQRAVASQFFYWLRGEPFEPMGRVDQLAWPRARDRARVRERVQICKYSQIGAPSLASSSAIKLPRIPACPGTQYIPTACRVEISFNAFWHCWTNEGVVLTSWRAFKAAWRTLLWLPGELSKLPDYQIRYSRISLTYFEIEFHKHTPR